jgi:hypothetical protein
MADYKNIKGFNIQYLDSDPPNPIEGQMWFNSTTQTLKGAEAGGAPIGTWSSGGTLNTTRTNLVGFGTLTAGVVAGGNPSTNATENYNGTAWTSSGNMPYSKEGAMAFGIQTAGVIYGGGNPAVTTSAEYNGTAWTAGNNANSAGTSGQGFGSLTAGVIASRASSGGGPTPAVVEEYNGTSWSEVNEVNTGRAGYERSSSGPQTAGIIYGGGVDGSGVTLD